MDALLKLYGFEILFFSYFIKSSSGLKFFFLNLEVINGFPGSTLQRAAAFSKKVFSAAGETDLVLRRIYWSLVGEGVSLPIETYLLFSSGEIVPERRRRRG